MRFVRSILVAALIAATAVFVAAPAAMAQPATNGVGEVAQVEASDGCTNAPDGFGIASFESACAKHDACYSAGSTTNRIDCDDALKSDIAAACGAAYAGVTDRVLVQQRALCVSQSDIYYAAVRRYGRSHYQGSGNPA